MDDLLTTKQLMEMLHIDRTTIYRMLNDGRLPGVRVGGQWRFSRQTIDGWLKEQNPPAPQPRETPDASPRAPRPSLEVLPLYCLQPIQEVFALTSETGAVTTDLDGNPLTPFSNPSSFCSLIQSTEEGRARCQASWKLLADKSQTQPRLEKCHAGLTYARGRVIVQDTFLAMLFVGQFAVDDPASVQAPANLEKLARSCHIDARALSNAAAELRVIPQKRADQLLELLKLVADTYSRIGEERLELLGRLKQVAEIVSVSS